MSKKSRVRFTEEFKAQAVALIRSGRTVQSVASELGVSESSLFHWNKQAKSSKGPSALDLQEENVRLKQQLRVVEQEREILKKSIALFVKIGS